MTTLNPNMTFLLSATNPSKLIQSHNETSQLLFAEKFLFKSFCCSIGIQHPDNYRFFFTFLCSFQQMIFMVSATKKFFLSRMICHHSIDNYILHITQVVPESTEVYERMSVMKTSPKIPKSQYFGRNLQFPSDDLRRKYHHSIENLNLHVTQVVSESTQVHHRMSANSTSWKTTKNSVFWKQSSVFFRRPTLKIPPLDRRFNPAYHSSGFRINTGI